MGNGTFDSGAAAFRTAQAQQNNTNRMAFTAAVNSGKASRECHPSLNLALKPIRECRDNPDNPEALPICVFLDETGSMGAMAHNILDDMHGLVNIVRDTGSVPHPAILVGAVGDSQTDRGSYEVAPIQAGEFESDDELIEQHLSNIYLEGNGQGNGGESYWLPMVFAAHQTKTDHWEKRGKKGHLVIIADEDIHDVDIDQAKDRLGINIEPTSLEELVKTVQERWNLYIIRPNGSGHSLDNSIENHWKALGVQHVVRVEDWRQVIPTAAALIAQSEGASAADIISKVTANGLTLPKTFALATLDGDKNIVHIDDENTSLTRI